MLIDQYYSENNNKIHFSQLQASNFAKKIADDFNPLHDADSRRFCVPGDLLFSLILARYGVTRHMHFTFSGMVTEEVTLTLPEESPQLSIAGNNGKEYLRIERSGDNSTSAELIDSLTHSYVTFSGHTFPHILIPLMKEKNVMINPDRPMVMYQSMLIELDRLDLTEIELELDQEKTVLEVNGKRGSLCLAFNLKTAGTIIGRGEKHMVVSGLRPYDQAIVDGVIAEYSQRKQNYIR